MPYITTAEKIGIEKGIMQGIEKGIEKGRVDGLLEGIELALELKFGFDGIKLMSEIRKIDDADTLNSVKEAVRMAKTIEDVRKVYQV